MSNFDELLCRLIRSNRRVIIPDIGAFITNSSVENTVFSPLLKHNDGFLENEIQKEGIANPAVFLRELAENIISVVERGQHFRIVGLGYFFKDGSMRFVFEETEKDAVSEYADDLYYPENRENRSVVWIVSSLICVCLLVCVLFAAFNTCASKKRSNMFMFQTKKPDNQFITVDKSGDHNKTGDVQPFPQAKNHHVVVACFEEKDNAEKFVRQCEKNGYDKAEILSATNGLYFISIGVFASRDDALNKKQEYENQFGEYSIILKINDFK
jgi:hypothetical protein